MSWKTQFPAAFEPPQELLDMEAHGEIMDLSWGNDACPHFGWHDTHGDVSVGIWCAPDVRKHPDYEKEFGVGQCRFAVTVVDEEDGLKDYVSPFREWGIETDDVEHAILVWKALLAEVRKKLDERWQRDMLELVPTCGLGCPVGVTIHVTPDWDGRDELTVEVTDVDGRVLEQVSFRVAWSRDPHKDVETWRALVAPFVAKWNGALPTK